MGFVCPCPAGERGDWDRLTDAAACSLYRAGRANGEGYADSANNRSLKTAPDRMRLGLGDAWAIIFSLRRKSGEDSKSKFLKGQGVRKCLQGKVRAKLPKK